jgi:hypothetical protein
MNEEQRNKLATEYTEDQLWSEEPEHFTFSKSSVVDIAARAFRAGWNACYAEMTTKRSEPEPDWFGKEQTRDCDLM